MLKIIDNNQVLIIGILLSPLQNCSDIIFKQGQMNFSLNLMPDDESDHSSLLSQEQSPQLAQKENKNTKTAPPKRKRKITNPYKWKSVQNTKYVNFLKSRLHLMKLPIADRKKIKINVIMSTFVKTRNPQQCRSHHQKMMLKYGTIENIISYYPKDCKEIKNPSIPQTKYEAETPPIEEMKNNIDDQKEIFTEPLWHQYLDLYSYHQSQQFPCMDEEF